MKRPILWLLLAKSSHPDLPYAIPTLSWMARDCGALLENYLEAEREGSLFAESGSTVLGGHHHQQFNYLCARFDVRILRLGPTQIFDSSIGAFDLPVLAESNHAAPLYAAILQAWPALRPAGIFYGPEHALQCPSGAVRIQPYLFPEILYRRALGLTASAQASGLKLGFAGPSWGAFVNEPDLSGPVEILDQQSPSDDWATLTTRLAQRWKASARGVVFGDPAAVLSQLATHCRKERVALYAPCQGPTPAQTRASHYAEAVSPVAAAAAELAVEIGTPVIHGRQTGDGDIFEWSKRGVCIQIVDPNRPAFPVVDEARHPWHGALPPAGAGDPTDEQLTAWARENRVLTTLVIHSGEVAHNEAMLTLTEMAGWSGLKFGAGVHAARYESCPQFWELIALAREHGGAAGLVEPLLHSGGRGVMAECNCPPELLADHCASALDRIREIAGADHVPRGYYAFMDSNLDLLDQVRGDLFTAIAGQGLDYIVSSARPGRNRVLWRDRDCVALNQTPRVVHGSSPFVRNATRKDIQNTVGAAGPGWIIATLDAPVVAFAPYIWREGPLIMGMVDELRAHGRINVLPRTIARYALIMNNLGYLPPPVCEGAILGRAE